MGKRVLGGEEGLEGRRDERTRKIGKKRILEGRRGEEKRREGMMGGILEEEKMGKERR